MIRLCCPPSPYQGYYSFGLSSRDAFHRLFLFHFTWAFIGVTLGSTAVELLQHVTRITQNPTILLQMVGNQLAAMSVCACATPRLTKTPAREPPADASSLRLKPEAES